MRIRLNKKVESLLKQFIAQHLLENANSSHLVQCLVTEAIQNNNNKLSEGLHDNMCRYQKTKNLLD